MSGPILLVLRILLAALLYGFLGLGLYILWRDLKRQAELAAARQVPPLSLSVAGEEGETRRTFSQNEVIVGRGMACDLSLEDKTISTRHARFSYHHGQWWLEDLGSTNGTLLNHQPVETAVVITSGDEVLVGQVEIKILD